MEYSSLYPISPLGESLVRTAETEQALSNLHRALVSNSIEIVHFFLYDIRILILF